MGALLFRAAFVASLLASAGDSARVVTVQGRARVGTLDVASAVARARFDARVRAAATVELPDDHPLAYVGGAVARLVAARDDAEVVAPASWLAPVVTGDHVGVALTARVFGEALPFAACRAVRATEEATVSVRLSGDTAAGFANELRAQAPRACLHETRAGRVLVSGEVARAHAGRALADLSVFVDGELAHHVTVPVERGRAPVAAARVMGAALRALLERGARHGEVDMLVRGVDRYGGAGALLHDLRAALGVPPVELHYARGQAAVRYANRPERVAERLASVSGGRLIVVAQDARTIVVEVR